MTTSVPERGFKLYSGFLFVIENEEKIHSQAQSEGFLARKCSLVIAVIMPKELLDTVAYWRCSKSCYLRQHCK